MIPRVRPSYGWLDLKAAAQARSDEPAVFERELAAYFGVKYAITFPYGRSVVYSFLKAFNLAGGEVVQPAYNCVVVAHATMVAGAHPVFVDAQSKSPNQIEEEMISKVTDRTVAVLPTSIFGVPFDAKTLCQSIRKRKAKAFILMDCAQCFNGAWNNDVLATQGDAAVLAFGIGKPMTSLYGGALLTNRDDVFSCVRNHRDMTFRPPKSGAVLRRWLYFLASWVALSGPFAGFTDWMEHARTPLYSYLQTLRSREVIKLPEDNQILMKPVEAGIGRMQLRRVSSFMRRRKQIAEIYARELDGIDGLELLNWKNGASFAIYAARLKAPKDRELMLKTMRHAGVQGDTVLNYVVPALDCYRAENFSGDPYPNARAWAQSVINIPNHPTMSDRQVYHVIDTVKRALRRYHGG